MNCGQPRVSSAVRFAWVLLCLLLAAIAASLLLGPARLPALALLRGLAGQGDTTILTVLWELRVPRTLLATVLGAGLGAAGGSLQALLRNPLADPGLLGISSCSALGAVLAFYSGLGASFALALPLGGLAGAVLGTLALLPLAQRHHTLSLVLGGVALGALASALTSLFLNLLPNPYAAYDIVFWLMGSLVDRSWHEAALAVPLMGVGLLLLLSKARLLGPLALGEEVAGSLGLDLRGLRRSLVLGTALCVGPGVAVAGYIGFVGLMVPHCLRPFVGHEPARLVPLSALAGSALTVLADVACRLPPGGELRLGVVTALLGAPFLLVLLRRSPATL